PRQCGALSAAPGRRRCGVGRRAPARLPLPHDERLVFANQQLEMLPLLFGELEEDLLPLGVLEAFPVPLEEPVRSALAADPDEIGLLVVDAARQPLRPLGEEAVGRALEEQERRTRFQLGIALEQPLIARLERAEVLLLLFGELLEDRTPPRILRDLGGAGVELEPAALGRDRDPQRVAREDERRRRSRDRRRGAAAGPAVLALPVDLQDALARGEAARRGDLLDERLDVGAEELGGLVAGLADQMEMAWVAVRVLERSEEHTSELQSRENLVCRLLLEKKK